MSNYFHIPEKIRLNVVVDKSVVVNRVVSMLNKMAESRFDGQNTQYVNQMQPEVDFAQDSDLVNDAFEEGIARIAKRIEPYVVDYGLVEEEVGGSFDGSFSGASFSSFSKTTNSYAFNLALPYDWKEQYSTMVLYRFEEYLTNYIVYKWVMMTSQSDAEQYDLKSRQSLRNIKGLCELRQRKVHRGWNTTY